MDQALCCRSSCTVLDESFLTESIMNFAAAYSIQDPTASKIICCNVIKSYIQEGHALTTYNQMMYTVTYTCLLLAIQHAICSTPQPCCLRYDTRAIKLRLFSRCKLHFCSHLHCTVPLAKTKSWNLRSCQLSFERPAGSCNV